MTQLPPSRRRGCCGAAGRNRKKIASPSGKTRTHSYTALNHYNISYLCLHVTGNILLTFMKSSLKCSLPPGLRKVTGFSERCHHFVFNLTPVRVPLTVSHAEVTVLQRTSNSVRAVCVFYSSSATRRIISLWL